MMQMWVFVFFFHFWSLAPNVSEMEESTNKHWIVYFHLGFLFNLSIYVWIYETGSLVFCVSRIKQIQNLNITIIKELKIKG